MQAGTVGLDLEAGFEERGGVGRTLNGASRRASSPPLCHDHAAHAVAHPAHLRDRRSEQTPLLCSQPRLGSIAAPSPARCVNPSIDLRKDNNRCEAVGLHVRGVGATLARLLHPHAACPIHCPSNTSVHCHKFAKSSPSTRRRHHPENLGLPLINSLPACTAHCELRTFNKRQNWGCAQGYRLRMFNYWYDRDLQL